jgi:glycosyltransferase involved in cell wall biosynthesis
MHILYIHQYFCPPGGAGNNRSFDLARAWVQAGHEVTMLTSTAYFPEDQRSSHSDTTFDCDGIRVVALAVDYRHLMGFGRRVLSFLKFYFRALRAAKGLSRPDMIYASSTPLTVGEVGRKLGRKWHIPFVFEAVDVWPDVPIGMGIIRNGMLQNWLHRRTDQIYAEAKAIVTLSDGMKGQILRHGVPEAKVHVVYNGVDLHAFPFVERMAGEKVHVIYTGTVGLANGVDAIVGLCARLRELGRTDILVTVVGGGNDWERVMALAQAQRLGNLDFRPTVPKEQVSAILATADIGLVTFAPFPVLEANSANKFYDYLASGLPVVINYRGWQAAYLHDYDCGLSSDMGDLEGFVRNVVRLADEPWSRRNMGRNGNRLARERFDRQMLAAELLRLFDVILNRP